MKWTDEQRKALRESIAHWERMREYRLPLSEKHESPSGRHCPCCELYAADWCSGCPIYEVTGLDDCDSTPWRQASTAFTKFKDGIDGLDAWVRAATKEINFLKKVLEAGK